MKTHPFSISTDESNDTELEKMNPITVQVILNLYNGEQHAHEILHH